MELRSREECGRYVEGELDRVIRSRPGWSARGATPEYSYRCAASRDIAAEAMAWTILNSGGHYGESWYRLEAHLIRQEFLVWFGNHQVGIEGLHWIMRPAVHVAFDDLEPMAEPFRFRFRLGDVLEVMMRSLDKPSSTETRFDLNNFSLT